MASVHQLALDFGAEPTKQCSKCGERRPVSAFGPNRHVPSGLQSHCKTCRNEWAKGYRKANPERIRESDRRGYLKHREKRVATASKWNKEHPERVKAIRHARIARLGGLERSFTAEEWTALCERHGWRCAACGERKPLTADHIVPTTLGGAPGIDNIQPLCLSCNSSKNDKHIDYRGCAEGGG